MALTKDIADKLGRTGVVAVLVVDRAQDAAKLAEALLAGGVDVMELTLRTPAALEALKVIKSAVPEMTAGVGTILTPQQVGQAMDAGAAFGVSPGVSRRVIEEAARRGLPFAPGICTPSDIEAAVECGCNVLKFFPAQPSGGLAYLRAVAAPYQHLGLRYVPLGGVDAGNLRDYVSDPLVLAVGGSALAPRKLISDGDWAGITALCRQARSVIDEARSRAK
jgi:2-dehydro-3-deoxyphosphogluconate aldolase/(4S)-4-hydroxy-2-oxoglutarate aldolase